MRIIPKKSWTGIYINKSKNEGNKMIKTNLKKIDKFVDLGWLKNFPISFLAIALDFQQYIFYSRGAIKCRGLTKENV